MATSKPYILTGIDSPPPGILDDPPFRLEINDFIKDEDMLNIYLLALTNVQNADQNEVTSAYQVGGIHGLPYTPWNGVNPAEDHRFPGYCTHGSVIFPTWHRPYVALIEQVLYEEAVHIAASYTDPKLKTKYGDAAKRFRQPYWDWAANANIPAILNTMKFVSVISAPSGTRTQISNPLLSYKFHPFDSTVWGEAGEKFGRWPQTLRHPSSDKADAYSQPERVQGEIGGVALMLRDRVYNILAYMHNWERFSNHTSSGDSLESVHDIVHDKIGGAGHMGNVGTAGMDPIFFLHHCNVDRYLALWQVLNPTIYVVPGGSGIGSATIPPQTIVDANTDLTPFRSAVAPFWSSAGSRHVTRFGHTYPELKGAARMSPEELQRQVTHAINKLYGPRPTGWGRGRIGILAGPGESTVEQAKDIVAEPPRAANAGDEHVNLPFTRRPSVPQIDHYRDWIATIVLKKYELPTSGYVHVFLSESVPLNDWHTAPELVGSVGNFRNNGRGCDNCNEGEAAGVTITGEVPLTGALVDRQLDLNDVGFITTHLNTHLHWRCQLVDGSEVALEDVPSLKVAVSSTPVTAPDNDYAFPIRGAFQIHHHITHGKLGGYSQGDIFPGE
uniref:tyrosinase n=1 Tax=Grifola frondosa TaxID=5627 RepID=A0A679EKB9_GRIFR|nr:tyrosinase [Grifola frondosa]